MKAEHCNGMYGVISVYCVFKMSPLYILQRKNNIRSLPVAYLVNLSCDVQITMGPLFFSFYF